MTAPQAPVRTFLTEDELAALRARVRRRWSWPLAVSTANVALATVAFAWRPFRAVWPWWAAIGVAVAVYVWTKRRGRRAQP